MMDYGILGKRMVEFGIGIADLEDKVNSLTAEGKIQDSDARALVTGFVDAALASHHVSAKAVYSLVVHGCARFLYNGAYPTIRQKILEKIATTGTGIEFLQEKKDWAGIQEIAKLAWEKSPELTLNYYKGEDRNNLLRQIANHDADNFQARGIVKRCLEELKDKDGLRQHAMKYLAPHDRHSVGILQELDTDEDFRTLVKHFSGTDLSEAYKFSLKIQNKTDEDKALFSKVKEEMILKEPETAARKFWEHDSKCWQTHQRRCTDKEGLIAAGRRLLQLNKLFDAVDAFSTAEYEGNEVLKLGLKLLKRYEKADGSAREGFKHGQAIEMMVKAVPFYLKEASAQSVIKIEALLGTECGEEVKRNLGMLLAKYDLPSKAYSRMMDLRKKTAEDQALIGELRKKMLNDTDHARYIFKHYEDQEGMRMFAEHAKTTHTEYAYENAFPLGDESLTNPLREALIAEKGLRYALHIFREKDEKGVQMVCDKLGKGIDFQTIEFLLDLKTEKKER